MHDACQLVNSDIFSDFYFILCTVTQKQMDMATLSNASRCENIFHYWENFFHFYPIFFHFYPIFSIFFDS